MSKTTHIVDFPGPKSIIWVKMYACFDEFVEWVHRVNRHLLFMESGPLQRYVGLFKMYSHVRPWYVGWSLCLLLLVVFKLFICFIDCLLIVVWWFCHWLLVAGSCCVLLSIDDCCILIDVCSLLLTAMIMMLTFFFVVAVACWCLWLLLLVLLLLSKLSRMFANDYESSAIIADNDD